MSSQKFGDTKKPLQRLEWKFELAQFLLEKNWDKVQITNMPYFLDCLMILPEGLEKGFRKDMQTVEQAKKPPFMTIWEREGMAQGHHDLLLRQMTRKFGACRYDHPY